MAYFIKVERINSKGDQGMNRHETGQRVAQVFLVWEDKYETVVTRFWFQQDWKL